MARIAISVYDDADGNARVEVQCDTSLPAVDKLTSAQATAVEMLTVAIKQAVSVVKNEGLLELLNLESVNMEPVSITQTGQIVDPAAGRPLTFGEKAVGLTFNPSNNGEVDACKKGFAAVIDQMDALRNSSTNPDVKRMAAVAITEAQTAQMWAVKAITWRA